MPWPQHFSLVFLRLAAGRADAEGVRAVATEVRITNKFSFRNPKCTSSSARLGIPIDFFISSDTFEFTICMVNHYIYSCVHAKAQANSTMNSTLKLFMCARTFRYSCTAVLLFKVPGTAVL